MLFVLVCSAILLVTTSNVRDVSGFPLTCLSLDSSSSNPWHRRHRHHDPATALSLVHNNHGDVSSSSSPAPNANTTTTTTTLSPGRRARKRRAAREEYDQRRARWSRQYGSFAGLQATFGAGPVWGDLSPEETRRLYHTLLPRSLLGLYELEVLRPEELAPLAYEARVAAKEYARSRCVWTGRLATVAFDQYRSVRDTGTLMVGRSSSPTWEEIWDKYERQIVREEAMEEEGESGDDNDNEEAGWKKRARRFRWGRRGDKTKKKDDKESSLTMRVYLRILERSCVTNQAFDSLFLKDDNEDTNNTTITNSLAEMSAKLEEDVRTVLLRPKESKNMIKRQQKLEKTQRKAREKEEKRQRKLNEKQRKTEQEKEEES